MRGGYSPIRPTPSRRVSSSSLLWSECIQSLSSDTVALSVALGGQPPCEARQRTASRTVVMCLLPFEIRWYAAGVYCDLICLSGLELLLETWCTLV
jgi:hypothetical protein